MEQKSFFMRGDAHHHLGETHLALLLLRSASHAVTLLQHLVRNLGQGAHDRRLICAQRRRDALIQSAEVAHAGSIGP